MIISNVIPNTTDRTLSYESSWITATVKLAQSEERRLAVTVSKCGNQISLVHADSGLDEMSCCSYLCYKFIVCFCCWWFALFYSCWVCAYIVLCCGPALCVTCVNRLRKTTRKDKNSKHLYIGSMNLDLELQCLPPRPPPPQFNSRSTSLTIPVSSASNCISRI